MEVTSTCAPMAPLVHRKDAPVERSTTRGSREVVLEAAMTRESRHPVLASLDADMSARASVSPLDSTQAMVWPLGSVVASVPEKIDALAETFMHCRYCSLDTFFGSCQRLEHRGGESVD